MDFIIISGFKIPIAEIPTPALAVPIPAPKFANTNANDTPINPKKASGPVYYDIFIYLLIKFKNNK